MSNTAVSAPIRPKIGRPPAAISAPPPVTEELLPVDEAEAESGQKTVPHRRFDAKLVMVSVGLVLVMTLVLSRVMTPALTNVLPPGAPPIPPLAQAAPATPSLPPPHVPVAGTLAPIGPAEPSVSYTPPSQPQPAIDNNDRQRLLSIISKD